MKLKNTLFLLCLVYLVLAYGPGYAGIVEKTYYFHSYSLKQSGKYQLICFDHTLQTGKAGEPTLAYAAVSLLLPPGEKAGSIEFVGENYSEITGNISLFPYQPSRPVGQQTPDGLVIQEGVYHQKTPYPDHSTGVLSTQYLYGHPFALCTFTPVVYLPGEKKAGYYQKVTIRIHTLTGGEEGQVPLPLNRTKDAVSLVCSLAQNPGMSDYYPPIVTDTSACKLLIISPDLFLGHFQDLVDFYFVRGIRTRIVSISSISSTYTGVDQAEKIRNCIIQEYLSHQVEYVLLAGDAELVPARGFSANVQSSVLYTDNNIPSDLYYSALDGNWNNDGDNLWGEIGEDDLLPEVSVGRFTVNTLAELSNQIYKSTHYQNFPIVADCRKPLLAGEFLYSNPITWGGDYLDLLIGDHIDNGYSTVGIPEWHNIQTLYDEDLPGNWTPEMLLAKINEGASFLHHCGHSNQDYLMRLNSSSIVDANFSQVDGVTHNFMPVYSHGCYCAAFDYSDCIAEKMVNLNTFAVAFIGNSRYGWFNEGTTEGPSIHLHREFVDAMYGHKVPQIGRAHLLSKIQTSPWVNAPGQWEEGALRWCFYDCNLLGDPCLSVWTDNPAALQISHVDTLTTLENTLAVYTDTAGVAMAGLYCIALKDSVMLGACITDSLGNATISLGNTLLNNDLITLIVSGMNCLPDTSFIVVSDHNSLSGHITYGNAQHSPLDSVVVMLKQQENVVFQTLTDSNGFYRIENIPPGTYSVVLIYGHLLGGVNSSDALAVLKHFVNLIHLTGLNLQAADCDGNNYINTMDALFIQKRFVGMISSFPVPDWTFEPKVFTIGPAEYPVIDIRGLCTGDVNASFNP
ncbi:MAG: C25 family cysteine peptidase [Bacteroidetes bacterium]|nr:C25 family cysteine peptidase [Bacteroidota bacterium]